jgi:P27 family predicted phage terminase small subunit
MGRRGPKPLPVSILEARGSRRIRKDIVPPAAPASVDALSMPDWLDPLAADGWRRITAVLKTMGILEQVDQTVLGRYCIAELRWKKAVAFILKNGEVYALKDKHGNVRCAQPYPQVAIANQLAAELGRLEQELGLTPSSRTRINAPGALATGPYNPKSRFFEPPRLAGPVIQ